MRNSKQFQFKQFGLIQEKSAMKVGTDGVLLGAWTDVTKVKNILDVGTGTGLIALMLAQRCQATITGIDIEKNAAEEARENIAQSPWNDRVTIQHCSYHNFMHTTTDKFDLIVSNPPFFTSGIQSKKHERNLARHAGELTFESLIANATKLLNLNGRLALIMPFQNLDSTLQHAKGNSLFVHRQTLVYSAPNKVVNRVLLELGKATKEPITNTITLRDKQNDYSLEFKKLTTNFYLRL